MPGNPRRRLNGIPLLFLVLFTPASCRLALAPVLEMSNLFTLGYGTMEDQITLLLDEAAVVRKTRVAMRGGLIYVASGYGNRVMKFTSYGDLLALYFNASQNPRPVLLESTVAENQITNRRAFAYPFNAIGEIAITGEDVLLVEDQVPDRLAVFDEELGVRLNRVVVRFDWQGRQIDYLGQEGIGGSFFPYIRQVQVTANDEVVVVALAPPRTIVYWFDSRGALLRRIDVTPQTLPVPSEFAATPILESVHADHELRRLYLKVNLYVRAPRSSERREGPVTDLVSRIYWIDIADGSYEGFVEVPRNVRRDRLLGLFGATEEYPYELVGTAAGEHLFLLSRESIDQSQFLILHTSGKVVRRRTLQLDYREVVTREFHVSHTGILTGLLSTRDGADVVWWRTDRLFGGER